MGFTIKSVLLKVLPNIDYEKTSKNRNTIRIIKEGAKIIFSGGGKRKPEYRQK